MPITRQEKLLNTLATGVASGVSPITREEQYLSYIAGETYTKPDAPITRKEAFLDKIPQGGGGGSGVTIKNQNKTITENGTYTADSGYTGLGTVTVDVQASGGDDKYKKFIARTATEITESDLTELDNIPSYAFYSYGGLSDVTLHSGITTVNDQAFSQCQQLQNVTIKGNAKIGKRALYNSSVKSVSFPNGAMRFDEGTFETCTSLESIEYPPQPMYFGVSCFNGCTSLKSVVFPTGATMHQYKGGSSICMGCSGLTSVDIQENGLTIIDTQMFHGCTSLPNITLPSTITKINSNAFYNCNSLIQVKVNRLSPPTLNSSAFTNCTALTKIIVPAGSAEAYKAATNWSKYADIIVEEGAV